MVAAPGRGEYRRVTAAAAEAVGVMVAAIENPIVVVPSGQRAVLRLAQGEASAVTEAVRMVIAAVGHAVMGVPPGQFAALHCAQRGAAASTRAAPTATPLSTANATAAAPR